MRSYAFLLVLLQVLGCSAIPLQSPELPALADKALAAAMTEVNSQYATRNLYRATRGSVTRVVPMGLNTMDLMLSFAIKETDCLKSTTTDLETCAFKPGLFTPSHSCSARVRMFPTSTQVVSVRCGSGTSSSSESSEEFFRGRRYEIPVNTVPVQPAPPQPTMPVEDQPRDIRRPGDGLINYLE